MAAALLPVRADAAGVALRLEPTSGGRLFVAVPTAKGTVLASLDAKGRIRSGWPVLLPRATGCELDPDLADGSVRAVCRFRKTTRAYALDAAGQLMPGWPVALSPGVTPTWRSDPARVVDGALYVVLTKLKAEVPTATLIRVSRDGSLRTGVSIRDHDVVGPYAAIGPDGAAYLVSPGVGDGVAESVVTALTLDGIRPGFPIRLDGLASAPSFGPDGRFFVTVEALDPMTNDVAVDSTVTVLAITADGRVAAGWPVDLPLDTWTRSADGAAKAVRPVAAPDGSVSVAVTRHATGRGTIVHTLGPTGRTRAGWPYRSPNDLIAAWTAFVCTCMCEPCACNPYYDTSPAIGPDGTLYVAQSADREATSRGNSIVALRPSGRARAGWPVTLVEEGGWFETFAVGEGAVFGFAVEPAGTRRKACGEKYEAYSGTVIALNGHGDPIYTTTLVVP